MKPLKDWVARDWLDKSFRVKVLWSNSGGEMLKWREYLNRLKRDLNVRSAIQVQLIFSVKFKCLIYFIMLSSKTNFSALKIV